ncbi:hypothetical protein FB451DRAFT_1507671 [Mycena latifolia]|nr:hypothetical protein FB451DRAFT_1507671 [Mycena latifolia]
MPSQSAQSRFNNIVTCLGAAVTTLSVVSANLETPFIHVISTTIQSLLTAAQVNLCNTCILGLFTQTGQTVKQNKDVCTQMLEQIHELLYAIIRLHITSAISGELSPNTLHALGKFTETLHKIHTFVEAQQEKSRIKHFFRQGELSTLLKGCQLGLQQALDDFKFLRQCNNPGLTAQHRIHIQFKLASLLPSEPKIFHGRDYEVSIIIQAFHGQAPRIAILGAGGMGKTSLARAILHHPTISSRYEQHRLFIVCDGISNSLQLSALIGAHVGLKGGKDLTQAVIHHFSSSPPALLILDNLETIWEPKETRGAVENLLSLLVNIEHLALITTMRGAERPANIQWTHPFLEPLKPLAIDAARKTFIDITDDGYTCEEIDQILHLADNMPLAIDLIAHLVDYEGLSSVLHRWETEKTSLISDGYDKASNLDLSISLSLESPRLASTSHSRDLLSLLAILPDGLSDAELLQSQLPLDNILACKAALLRTSLAYLDDQRHLKALVPIREYMQKMHPPIAPVVQSLLKHFQQLLRIYETYSGTLSAPSIFARIASNFSNIQGVLVKCLGQDNPDMINSIYAICHLDHFSRQAGHGQSHLMTQIPDILPCPRDHRLEVYFITGLLAGNAYNPALNSQHLIDQALDHFPHFDDPDLKCAFYARISEYYRFHNNDIPRAIQFTQTGLRMSIWTGNIRKQAEFEESLALSKWRNGDYSAARLNAYKSHRLAKISGNLLAEATALRVEAMCWEAFGQYNHSITLFNRARELLNLCGMSGGHLDHGLMTGQAEVLRLKSEYLEARDIHTQVLHELFIGQETFQHALALSNIAEIDVEIGASKQNVQANIDTGKSIFTTVGHSMAVTFCDTIKAALDMREGNLLAAEALFKKCLKFAWGRDTHMVGYCLERLGDVQKWNAGVRASSNWTFVFLVHSLKLHRMLDIHKALQFIGDVYVSDGDQYTAASLFTVALEGFTQMDVHRSRADCMVRLGHISRQQGDMEKAAEFWGRAHPLFARSSQTTGITEVDEQLAKICHRPVIKHSPTLDSEEFHPDIPLYIGEVNILALEATTD